ncbi:MAG: hypothetical protein VR70_09315 [Rhodospirillaceae bacterium BRH_c57]|nr:MAG: hypothetical protein VR70_09315 [Rhodospirillaceae bacterium BRH_c57]
MTEPRSPPGAKIKVLVVDDSATVRQALCDILNAEPDIEVIGTAGDPYAAAQRMQHDVPDVIMLDIEMPRMDGITFLRKLMEQHPIPVVICSSLPTEGSDALFQALEAGAVNVITKPSLGSRQFFMESRIRICDAVRAAAQSDPRRRTRVAPTVRPLVAEKLTADAILAAPTLGGPGVQRTADKVVCIGASTGGTESLLAVLRTLPVDAPGIVIVQHMPQHFTAAFARRLDGLCAITVKEAVTGDVVRPGQALIAPGNHHMLLKRAGSRYTVEVRDGPLVSRHRPSVDVLFRSAARHAGGNAVGILMTGMGDDGARGLLEMRQAGAITVAQDEASCIVFGMPREAIRLGAAQHIVSLDRLAGTLVAAAASLKEGTA